MKGFFKKLSLVLVAALIITMIPANMTKAEDMFVIAPAPKHIKIALQDAKTASDALSSYIIKVGDKADFKFYGCVDYKTTGKGWESSNEAVATVDNAGNVTAVAAGAAQITYNATGYICEPLTVIVADAYTADIAKQDSAEPCQNILFDTIGATQDFKFIGAKGYSISKHTCTWLSTNNDVATVNNVGLVTAVGEGEAQIVLTIVDKTTNKVAFAVAPLKVTVAEKKLEVNQISWQTVEAKVYGAELDNVSAWLQVENGEQQQYVSVDKEKGLITFYNGLEDGKQYRIEANGLTTRFFASNGKIDDLLFEYGSFGDIEHARDNFVKGVAYENEICYFSAVKFYDENGVEVLLGNNTVEYEDICNGVRAYYYDEDGVYIAKGETHTLIAKVIDAETGKVLASKELTITAQPKPAWSLLQNCGIKLGVAGTAYDNCSTDLRLSTDDGAAYGIALDVKDIFNKSYKTAAGECNGLLVEKGQVIFESSNYDVLGVTDSGLLEARNQGFATVFVYFVFYSDGDSSRQSTKMLLGTARFQVVGPLVPTTVTLDNAYTSMYSQGSYVRISDEPGILAEGTDGLLGYNSVIYSFTIKDQLGRVMTTDNGLSLDITAVDQQNRDNVLEERFMFAPLRNISNDEAHTRPAGIPGAQITSSNGKVLAIFQAVDFADENGKQIYNNLVTFKFSKNNQSKSTTSNLVIFNIDAITPAVDPAVVWYNPGEALAPLVENFGQFFDAPLERLYESSRVDGLGNTDIGYRFSSESELDAAAVVVNVHPVGNAFVYGYAPEDTMILDYNGTVAKAFQDVHRESIESFSDTAAYSIKDKKIANLSSRELESLMSSFAFGRTENFIFGEFIVDGKASSDFGDMYRVTLSDPGDVGDRRISTISVVKLRDAFENLGPADFDVDDYNPAYDVDGNGVLTQSDYTKLCAIALSKIKSRTYDFNIYKITNSNSTIQGTSTYTKTKLTKYDAATPFTLYNNDEKNYNLTLNIADLTYDGDFPEDNYAWLQWLVTHTSVETSWAFGPLKKPVDVYSFSVPHTSTLKGVPAVEELLFGNPMISTLASQNSKYIQSIGFFFNETFNGDSGRCHEDLVTYINLPFNKKITNTNFSYKYEDFEYDTENWWFRYAN